MNGIYAFLLGIAAVIGAWIFGKVNGTKETKTKISGEITIQKQKTEKAEKERDLAVSSAQTVSQSTAESDAINRYFDEFEGELRESKKTGNTDYAIEAAKKLAERAEAWRKRNSQ